MPSQHSETAEQKLLKMIETSSAEEGLRSKKKKPSDKGRSSLSALKTVNRLLLLGVIAAGFFLFQEIKAGNGLLAQELELPDAPTTRQVKAGDMLAPTVQKLSFYTSPLNRRNLFEPYEQKVKNVVEVSDENKTIANKTSHLRLVGVSWMDSIESASVMLEDTQQDLTYFLQANDKLGEVNIKTIYADSVELGYENEEIMIRYDTLPQ
ncbi:MAG TPA: hypothetical protein VI749_00035 [Candidatus Omnitrophota bacterium]|nr:hypothetical protein [Candidatus Omnitrophota bacterium]